MKSCDKLHRALTAALAGEPQAAAQTAALWSHLASCQGCARTYDRVATVLRRSAKEGDSLYSNFELEVSKLRVLGRARAERNAFWSGLPLRRLAWVLAAVAAAAALLALGLSVVAKAPGRELDEGMQLRDGSTDPLFAVRALCATRDADGELRFQSLSQTPGPTERETCPNDGELGFAYLAREQAYLAVIAQRGPRSAEVLTVDSSGRSQQLITPTLSLLPLEAHLPVGAASRLYFVFGREPLAVRDLEDAVFEIEAGRDLAKLEGASSWHTVIIDLRMFTSSSEQGGEN